MSKILAKKTLSCKLAQYAPYCKLSNQHPFYFPVLSFWVLSLVIYSTYTAQLTAFRVSLGSTPSSSSSSSKSSSSSSSHAVEEVQLLVQQTRVRFGFSASLSESILSSEIPFARRFHRIVEEEWKTRFEEKMARNQLDELLDQGIVLVESVGEIFVKVDGCLWWRVCTQQEVHPSVH